MFGTGHRKYVAHGTVTESVGVCIGYFYSIDGSKR